MIIILTIEDYIARRKKEDKLNEFNSELRTQNMKLCVDYVFEYFNNYLNITEAEEKTELHNEKIEKYRQQLRDFDPEVREWLVSIYNEHGNHMNRLIGNILKEDELFFLYDSDSEFRNASYDCYSKLIKRFPYIKDKTEMLYLMIKDYHRVESERQFIFGTPSISEEINDWLEKTWTKNHVNLLAFSLDWTSRLFYNEDTWPTTHKIKTPNSWRKYEYDYKQKSNLFNIDSLYRRIPKKSFIKGRKQEFEVIFMYSWLNDIYGDDDYWHEYLEKVLPELNKSEQESMKYKIVTAKINPPK